MKVVRKINGREVTDTEFAASVDPAKLREMLESGQVPAGMTDSVFLEGETDNSQQQRLGMFAEQFKSQALAAGVDPKGKVYKSGLASYPGDPSAWVNSRADVLRVCEEKNLTAHDSGAVARKHDNSRVEE